jgi:excinuclease UvrABC nuclease subunit
MTATPTTIKIAKLPSVLLTRRSALPDVPAIYFVLAPDREVLYVGRARSLSARWRGSSHHRYAQVDLDGARIAWLAIRDAESLPDLERSLIERFQPRLNGTRISVTALGPVLHVQIKLDGEQVVQFLRYKSSQFLHNNSSAARKLMFDRLAQIDAQEAAKQ